ncbi:hypothetical protein QCA50_001820 [Cerrena zonata]|uniref:Uncharacterized protein n=1 Tax=Cerrena zonata TaxID=2478898 RepID=A0AAW0GM24_9APHY
MSPSGSEGLTLQPSLHLVHIETSLYKSEWAFRNLRQLLLSSTLRCSIYMKKPSKSIDYFAPTFPTPESSADSGPATSNWCPLTTHNSHPSRRTSLARGLSARDSPAHNTCSPHGDHALAGTSDSIWALH